MSPFDTNRRSAAVGTPGTPGQANQAVGAASSKAAAPAPAVAPRGSPFLAAAQRAQPGAPGSASGSGPTPAPAPSAQRTNPFGVQPAASSAGVGQTQASRLAALATRHAGQGAANQRKVSGSVHDIRMANPTWGTASLVTDDNDVLKLKGAGVAELIEGREYTVVGTVDRHPKYGESIEVLSSTFHIRLNRPAITKFVSDNYKGIGVKLADKFVRKVVELGGDEGLAALRGQLLNAPWDVDFSIIGKEGSYKMDDEERERAIVAFIRRDLATRLSGLPSNVIASLARWLYVKATAQAAGEKDPKSVNLVELAWTILEADPYEATSTVSGYSFMSADLIGRAVGIERTAPVRLRALAAHALVETCSTIGHSYVDRPQAVMAIKRMDAAVPAETAMAYALESGMVILEDHEGEELIYPIKLHRAETELAARLAKLTKPGTSLQEMRSANLSTAERRELKKKVAKGEAESLDETLQSTAKRLGPHFKNGLDESQLESLKSILTSKGRIHTLTAGPGCGKTAVMQVLLAYLPTLQPHLCAPTGKAAKNLTSRVADLGLRASTICSLLKGSSEAGFSVNESSRLEGDLLVLDEASMPDLVTVNALLAAMPKNMHLLILGDPDQLQSIDPGRVLRDVMDIEGVDHNRLTKTHRNSGYLLDLIKSVGNGKIDIKTAADVEFSGTLPDPHAGFSNVVSEYLASVARVGEENTILLMSRRKGEVDTPGWNTTYANAKLRSICNPYGAKIPGSAMLVGDRVMIRKNMTIDKDGPNEEIVVNGDTGKILSFTLDNKRALESITVKLDDGRTIALPSEATGELGLAYAMTVHAAQGSEYKEVIAVITKGAPGFINRSTLYTALSRTKNNLKIWADNADLRTIAATPPPPRNSLLSMRTQAILDGQCEGSDMHVDDESDGTNESSAQHRQTMKAAA